MVYNLTYKSEEIILVTIKEIAAMADVSTTTVSNVINGKTSRVSKAVIEKIEKLLKEYRYVSPMGLRALSKSSSKIIGLVSFSEKHFDVTMQADPFYGSVIGIAEQKIHEAGYYMMLYSASRVEDIFQLTQAWNVDGIIAVTFDLRECAKLRQMTDRPLVTIDLTGTPPETVVNIGLDDFGGCYEMTRYLIQCGYRNIYTLTLKNLGADIARYQGFKKAMLDSGLPVAKENHIILENAKELRIRQFENYIRHLKKNDALFFFSDYSAIEAISLFIDHHIAIPGDIGVVGFDDIIQASLCHPKLTTVRQSFRKKAELAVDCLIRMLNGLPVENCNIALPTEIIVRQSTQILYGASL